MDINTTPGYIFAWGTGILVLILGALVLAASRKKSNVAFAVYTAGFGGQAIWSNMQFETARMLADDFWWVFAAFYLLTAVGIVMLVRSPFIGWVGLSVRERVVAGFGPGLYVVATGTLAVTDTVFGPTDFGVTPDRMLGWRAFLGAFALVMGAAGWLTGMAAMRVRREPEQAGPLAAVSIAFLVWPMFMVALQLGLSTPAVGWLLVALALYSGMVWLFTVTHDSRRQARNVAIIPLSLALTAYLVSLGASDPLAAVNQGFFGAGRIIAAGILAFAIVRHQILGFDVKVRRGIKGSTLAALFFAVFFVASETTAELFSSSGAGPYVGIAIAGLLVFFLAPLQRWADRLAGSATNDAKPFEEQSAEERLATYRATAVAAWSDGSVDGKERALLDSLRETLGLSFEQAGRIESEVSA